VRKFLLLVVFTLFALNKPSNALAHFQDNDGAVSGLLHIIPDDSPVIGEEAILNFTITNTQGQFMPTDCDCKLTIAFENEVGREYFLDSEAKLKTIFTKRGTYKALLEGTPKNTKSFKAFKLNFSFRVERMGNVSVQSMTLYQCVFICLVIALIVGLAIAYLVGRKKKK
jgi:hypothetical protein